MSYNKNDYKTWASVFSDVLTNKGIHILSCISLTLYTLASLPHEAHNGIIATIFICSGLCSLLIWSHDS